VAAPPRTVALGERQLTRIGLGTNRLADTPENHSFLEASVDAGVNFIDSAHLYAGGESEKVIGTVLASLADDPVVATKGGFFPDGVDGLRKELETSFKRLRADTIALYYLHRVDPDVPIEDAMGLLKEYRDAGRIAHVGVSQVSVEQAQRASSVVPIAAVQNEYNLSNRRSDDVVDYCEGEGIVFVPFYPLQATDSPAIAEVADRHDASPGQIKLAWLLRRSSVVVPIPGTLSIEHLRANLAALDIELTDDEFETLGAGG